MGEGTWRALKTKGGGSSLHTNVMRNTVLRFRIWEKNFLIVGIERFETVPANATMQDAVMLEM
jgi:hypothetical protein